MPDCPVDFIAAARARVLRDYRALVAGFRAEEEFGKSDEDSLSKAFKFGTATARVTAATSRIGTYGAFEFYDANPAAIGDADAPIRADCPIFDVLLPWPEAPEEWTKVTEVDLGNDTVSLHLASRVARLQGLRYLWGVAVKDCQRSSQWQAIKFAIQLYLHLKRLGMTEGRTTATRDLAEQAKVVDDDWRENLLVCYGCRFFNGSHCIQKFPSGATEAVWSTFLASGNCPRGLWRGVDTVYDAFLDESVGRTALVSSRAGAGQSLLEAVQSLDGVIEDNRKLLTARPDYPARLWDKKLV